jgi:hypothetical protein
MAMEDKQESAMATAAALLVLFTTMLNPLVSVGLAVALLIVFAVYKYRRPRKH